jgi:glutathione peroxidase
MSTFLAAGAAVLFAGIAVAADGDKKPAGPLDFKMTGIDGKEHDLAQYKGKVVLVVNVASQCGYTPQYKGLQELYEKYERAGLVVIGVPSNDFGKQEPGTDEEIQKFCKTNYKVSFPMLSKVSVKGDDKVPLYKYLTAKETSPKFGQDQEVKWNFEKFLIGRNGEIAGRFMSRDEPDSDKVTKAITAELEKK